MLIYEKLQLLVYIQIFKQCILVHLLKNNSEFLTNKNLNYYHMKLYKI